MGLISMPFAYIGGLLFALFVIIQFTAGGFAFDQMWTNQALNNATSAAITQVAGGDSTNSASAQVLNTTDALNVAENVWAVQNKIWTPSGQPIVATFTPTAVNATTPNGEFDTITGTAQIPFQENSVNNFINSFNKNGNAVYGGTVTDTVSSTLPGPLQ